MRAPPEPVAQGNGCRSEHPTAEDSDEITVTLTQPDGTELAGSGTMASDRPKGDGCSPTCTHAEVSLEA